MEKIKKVRKVKVKTKAKIKDDSVREKYRKKKVKVQVKVPISDKKPLRKLKRKKLYVKEKCHYHDGDIRCTNNAIGSGQLCKKHGGEKDMENVLSPEATQLYMAEYGGYTKFNPAIHPLQMIDLSRQGLSEVEVAAEIGVGVSTLKKWAELHSEFSVAHEIGQALYESWWLQKGKEGLDARYFNTSLFKFLTGNKLGYADKVETKNLNMNTCGVLVVPAKQSIEEWATNAKMPDMPETPEMEPK